MPDSDVTLSREVGSSSTQNEDTTGQATETDNQQASSESLNGSEGSGEGTEQRVPYARLKEKVDEANSLKAEREALAKQVEEYKSWDTAYNLIKEQFGSPDKYNEALIASRRQQEEAEIAEQVRQEVEARNLDEATANQVYQTKLAKKDFEKTKTDLDRVLLEQKLTLARNQYPEMDEETVLVRAKKDGSDLIAIAQKSHERELKKTQDAEERAIARYNAKKEETKQIVPPEGSGGRMVQADRCPDPKVDRKAYENWWRAKGIPVSN